MHIRAIYATRHVHPYKYTQVNPNGCESTEIHTNPNKFKPIHTNPHQSTSIHANPRPSTKLHAGPGQSTRIQADPHPSTAWLASVSDCCWGTCAACIRPGWSLYLIASGVLAQRASGVAGVCAGLWLGYLRSVHEAWLVFVFDSCWRPCATRISRGWRLHWIVACALAQRASGLVGLSI